MPVILVLYVLLIVPTSATSLHTPMKLTWQILSQTGNTVWSLTENHAVGTWWPQLTPDFCQLAAGAYNWDIVTQEANNLQKEMPTVYGVSAVPWTPIPIGCASVEKRCELASTDFYVCPRMEETLLRPTIVGVMITIFVLPGAAKPQVMHTRNLHPPGIRS